MDKDTDNLKIIRNKDNIIISHNGRKLIQPLDKYINMTDEEIKSNYIKIRNIKNNRI